MLPLIDIALNSFAILSTIVATLRAGSRILHISTHKSIGVMKGPMILPPSIASDGQANTTVEGGVFNYALYELSENFKHCVRLSIVPSLYQNVQFQVPILEKRPNRKDPFDQQPYSLGATPYVPTTFRSQPVVCIPSSTTITNPQDTNYTQISEEENIEGTFTDAEMKRLQNQESVPERSPGWSWRKPFHRAGKRRSQPRRHNLREADPASPLSKWDYGKATEADFYYNITASAFGNPRHRLAQLTVFCPKVFENLRSIFGISEDSYLQSILASGPFVSFQSNSKGAARVGGVFFFTRDGAYMIKTIKQEEAQTLLRILPKYHRHLKRYGRSSLLTRFCGMYQVNIEQEEDPLESFDDASLAPIKKVQTFVVMNAVFPAEASSFISERFDLKGSTVGREVSEEELRTKGSNAVMKDLDLAREVELIRSNGGKHYGLTIGASAKAALLSQLREDVKFLVDCQVMDYSLLVGIVLVDYQQKRAIREAVSTIQKQDRILEQIQAGNDQKRDSAAISAAMLPFRLMAAPPIYMARKVWGLGRLMVDSIFTSPLPYYGSGSCVVNGGKLSVFHGERRGERAIYYMGLIDFLQPWTKRKVVERYLKGMIGYDTKAISSVTPEEYATRFLSYLDNNVT